jgi:hypothetical protein
MLSVPAFTSGPCRVLTSFLPSFHPDSSPTLLDASLEASLPQFCLPNSCGTELAWGLMRDAIMGAKLNWVEFPS